MTETELAHVNEQRAAKNLPPFTLAEAKTICESHQYTFVAGAASEFLIDYVAPAPAPTQAPQPTSAATVTGAALLE